MRGLGLCTLFAFVGVVLTASAQMPNVTSEEGIENILASQLACGAWSKNVDYRKRAAKVPEDPAKQLQEATIDNGATWSEIRMLCAYAAENPDEELAGKARLAAAKGLEWLLDVQLPNGGWSQFPGRTKGYWTQITFNDNAMTGVLVLLKDVADRRPPLDGFPEPTAKRCREAFDRGIACLLACQIRVKGERTVWCQQHDRETLAPCGARAFELPGFVSQESAKILKLLESIETPSPEVRAAVEGGAKWFREHALNDDPGGNNPRWARYYDLETGKPFFCDRDGVKRWSLDEVGKERRRGYSWYNHYGNQVEKDYQKWLKRLQRTANATANALKRRSPR